MPLFRYFFFLSLRLSFRHAAIAAASFEDLSFLSIIFQLLILFAFIDGLDILMPFFLRCHVFLLRDARFAFAISLLRCCRYATPSSLRHWPHAFVTDAAMLSEHTYRHYFSMLIF